MRKTLLLALLYLTWLIPVTTLLLALILGILKADPLYMIPVVIAYTVIWMMIADKILTKYAIPRASRKTAERISEIFRVKKVDPRLAYFVDKWLKGGKTGIKEERPRGITLKRVTLPSTGKVSGVAEIYEEMMRIAPEVRELYERSRRLFQGEEGGEAGEARRERREELSAERMSEQVREHVEAGAEVSEVLSRFDDLSMIFSRRSKCFLTNAFRLREFSINELAEVCGAHWLTVRRWLQSALRMGLVYVCGERRNKYCINAERIREILSLFPRE